MKEDPAAQGTHENPVHGEAHKVELADTSPMHSGSPDPFFLERHPDLDRMRARVRELRELGRLEAEADLKRLLAMEAATLAEQLAKPDRRFRSQKRESS